MKGFVMNNTGPALLLIALLAALPGCGNGDQAKSKKQEPPKKGKKVEKSYKMNQKMVAADEFSDVSVPLADADGADFSDDSLKSFFSDMDEFVAFNENADTETTSRMSGEQFSWKDTDDDSKRLETVYFEFGKHRVDEDQEEKIEYNTEEIKRVLADAKEEEPDAKLIIEGHACASAGSAAYNLALSEKRAKEIADRLASSGIARDDMKVVGRGYEILVAKEGTREEQWVNRRVELHVVSA